MAEYRLEMRGVSKSFPGVKALDQVNLKVRPGTVHALMGENGAGKSTLMKCLFGIYHMDEGEIYLDGEKVSIANPDEALQKACNGSSGAAAHTGENCCREHVYRPVSDETVRPD